MVEKIWTQHDHYFRDSVGRRYWLAFLVAASRSQTRARINASARITGSILWDDVDVGADVVIDQCIITDRVRVPPGAAYRHTTLLQRDDSDELIAMPFTPPGA